MSSVPTEDDLHYETSPATLLTGNLRWTGSHRQQTNVPGSNERRVSTVLAGQRELFKKHRLRILGPTRFLKLARILRSTW